MAAATTAVLVLLLAVASSSGRTDIWRNQSSRSGPAAVSSAAPTTTVAAVSPAAPVRTTPPRWGGTLLQVLASLLFATIALLAVRATGGWSLLVRRRVRGAHRRGTFEPLPEVVTAPVSVDAAAAQAALATGTPRNAIVACWLQLERDAAAGGLARTPAETSAEYATRVIASSSIDEAPIHELAALYREARFSAHVLGDDHRARADAALARVVHALHARVPVAR